MKSGNKITKFADAFQSSTTASMIITKMIYYEIVAIHSHYFLGVKMWRKSLFFSFFFLCKFDFLILWKLHRIFLLKIQKNLIMNVYCEKMFFFGVGREIKIYIWNKLSHILVEWRVISESKEKQQKKWKNFTENIKLELLSRYTINIQW